MIALVLAALLFDLPAAHQLHAWLDAYNSGDRAALLKFYEANDPAAAASIDREMMMRLNMTGGYDLKKVEESTDTRTVAVLKARDLEQYARVTLEVEPNDAHHIRTLDVRAIDRPKEFPSPRTSDNEAIAALRAKLDAEAAADRFSGAVLVAKNGKPIFDHAYGFADREKHLANRLDTRFRLGSMNKIFTAVAVLQLAQAGKLALDAPIGTVLRDYPNHDVAAKVRIKDLLMHTGGTGDIFGPEYDAHRLELRALRDYVNLYGERGLEFEPGTRRAYSNYGFILLGRLIEVASGESYDDYVRDHIFKAAGMTRSGAEPESVDVPGRAVAYTQREGGWHSAAAMLPFRGTSAGGGYSTVGDLLRFMNALEDHTLLDAHSLDLLIDGKPFSYGSGGRTWEGVRYFGHNGGFPGMNTDMESSLRSGYTIIVLSNFDPPAAQRISEFIGSRLPD